LNPPSLSLIEKRALAELLGLEDGIGKGRFSILEGLEVKALRESVDGLGKDFD